MVVHKSRLERDKEAAAAAAKGAGGHGGVPGYMRATSAFASKRQAAVRQRPHARATGCRACLPGDCTLAQRRSAELGARAGCPAPCLVRGLHALHACRRPELADLRRVLTAGVGAGPTA